MKKQILFFLVIFSCASFVHAADGDLDTEFNPNGLGLGTSRPGVIIENYDAGATASFGNGVVQQPDGKLVLSGFTTIGGVTSIALARFKTDGTFDSSFGTGGKTITTLPGNFARGFNCALQTDGKIVVVGTDISTAPDEVVVARYTSAGVLDTTFNSGGTTPGVFKQLFGAANNFSSPGENAAITVQSDGKILVAGETASVPAAALLVRLNSDGTLDTTFGGGAGFVALNTAGAVNHVARDVVELDSGKLLVAGFYDPGFNTAFVLRLNSDGTLDTTFNSGGAVPGFVAENFGSGSSSFGNKILVQSDGGIILAGEGLNNGGLARFNTDGTPDNTFGDAGVNHTTVAGPENGYEGAAFTPDGKIVATGQDTPNTLVSRFSGDGVLDVTFGTGGSVTVDIDTAGAEDIQAMTVQSDNNIVIAGRSIATGFFMITRLGNTVLTSLLTSAQLLTLKYQDVI